MTGRESEGDVPDRSTGPCLFVIFCTCDSGMMDVAVCKNNPRWKGQDPAVRTASRDKRAYLLKPRELGDVDL